MNGYTHVESRILHVLYASERRYVPERYRNADMNSLPEFKLVNSRPKFKLVNSRPDFKLWRRIFNKRDGIWERGTHLSDASGRGSMRKDDVSCTADGREEDAMDQMNLHDSRRRSGGSRGFPVRSDRRRNEGESFCGDGSKEAMGEARSEGMKKRNLSLRRISEKENTGSVFIRNVCLTKP
jgi:hypothetical protein